MLDRYLSFKKPILKSLANERRRVRTSDSSTPLLSSCAPAGNRPSTSTYHALSEKISTEHIEMPSTTTTTPTTPQRPSLFVQIQRSTSRGERRHTSYTATSAANSPTFESLGSGRHANQWLFDAEGWRRFLSGGERRS